MSAPFKPPRGVTVELPYRSLVLRADPEFEYKNRHQLFYEFSNGRTFREDENQHGAYAIGPPVRLNLAGVSASGAAGTISVPPVLLIGVSATGSATQIVGVGSSPGLPVSVPLSGVGAAGTAGFIQQITDLLTGVGGVGTAGQITGIATADSVTLSGVSATATVGIITIPPSDLVPLTGVSATGHAGIVVAPPTVALRADFSAPGNESWFFY